MTNKEEWKDIPDYEGYYQASTEGRIRSVDRWIEVEGQHGTYTKFILSKLLKPIINNYGHVILSLSIENVPQKHSVSRLVLQTFEGEPPEKNMVAQHKNCIILDNKLSNLKWGKRSTCLKCALCNNNRLVTKEDIKYIRENPKNLTLQKLAYIHDVSPGLISNIQKRRVYDYIK